MCDLFSFLINVKVFFKQQHERVDSLRWTCWEVSPESAARLGFMKPRSRFWHAAQLSGCICTVMIHRQHSHSDDFAAAGICKALKTHRTLPAQHQAAGS